MNFITKFFLYNFFVILLSKMVICDREMSFELVPKVVGVTEVLSRRDQNIEDAQMETDKEVQTSPVIDADELKKMCTEGMELVRNKVTKEIEFSNELIYGEQKKYVVESARDGWCFSVEVLTAFMCPTEPKMYINVKINNEKPETLEVFVIFKDRDRQPKLKYITTFAIKLVENIYETYSDEINTYKSLPGSSEEPPTVKSNLKNSEFDENKKEEGYDDNDDDDDDEEEEPESEYNTEEDDSEAGLENSLIDTDDLEEYQRVEMCRRAAYIVSDLNVKLRDGEQTGPSKYYSLTTKQENVCEDESKSIDNLKINAVQAFRCSSTPEDIYLNVDEDEDEDNEEDEYSEKFLLRVIMKRSKLHPLFDIFIYRLKFYKEIIPASKNDLADLKETKLASLIEDFAIDLDGVGEQSRRSICEKAILTTLRTGVQLMNDIEIGPTEFYEFKIGKYSMIVQAISCPTNCSVPVYVHVGMDHRKKKRAAAVYVKDDEYYKNLLFPWVEHK